MIVYTKTTDERREAGTMECWCLHGAVGMAADWRNFSKQLGASQIGSRAIDLWRFLEDGSKSLRSVACALNDECKESSRNDGNILVGYSMGGRLALHSLLEKNHLWKAAVIISANPGISSSEERAKRLTDDAHWAMKALTGDWQKFLDAWDAQAVLSQSSSRSPALRSQLLARRQEVARSFIDWSLGAQDSLWDRLSEITIPVLWIVGENDEKFKDIAERAVALIPNAKLSLAPASGHRVPWEADAWFAEMVTRFIKLGAHD